MQDTSQISSPPFRKSPDNSGLCDMLALALISVKIVLELFLESFMNYTVIRLTTKKWQKIRASLSTDSVSSEIYYNVF